MSPVVFVKLDPRSDFAGIHANLAERVQAFDPDRNDGPGKMVEVGFQYSQSGWVGVVFDTRPDAEPDGEWSIGLDGNELEQGTDLAETLGELNWPISSSTHSPPRTPPPRQPGKLN